jgi:uncharacterized Zn-finger protein
MSESSRKNDGHEKVEVESASSTRIGQIRRSVQKPRKLEWACDFPGCNAVFYSKSSKFRHKKLHGEPGSQYHCNECPATFLVKLDLIDHQRKQHMEPDSYYNCDKCERTFSSISNLNAHKEIHGTGSVPKYTCEWCAISYFHRSGIILITKALYRHQRNEHKINRSNTADSTKSGSVSPDAGDIEWQPSTPQSDSTTDTLAQITCGFCNMIFSSYDQYVTHLGENHFLSENKECIINACQHKIYTKMDLAIHHATMHPVLSNVNR